jgi:hypothetical protein
LRNTRGKIIEETSFKALLHILDIASLCPSESVFVADFLLESLKRLVVVLTTLILIGMPPFLSPFSDRASVLDAHVVTFFTSAIVTRTRPGIILLSSKANPPIDVDKVKYFLGFAKLIFDPINNSYTLRIPILMQRSMKTVKSKGSRDTERKNRIHSALPCNSF